jgi:hypothetical protein
MFTIEPVVAPGGRRREGNSIRWARSPKRIYVRQSKSESMRKQEQRVVDIRPCPHLHASSLHQVRNAITRGAPSFPTVNMKLSGDLANMMDTKVYGDDAWCSLALPGRPLASGTRSLETRESNNEDNSQPTAAPSESKPLSTDTLPPNSSSELASSSPSPTPDRLEFSPGHRSRLRIQTSLPRG